MDGRTEGRKDEQTNEQTNERKDERKKVREEQLQNGRAEERKDVVTLTLDIGIQT